jgi:tetratricopeptide (TPR) repeat protein
LLIVGVYASVRHFQFVNWDDPEYITDNPHVLGGLAWQSVKWALTTGSTPYWHPLTWISHLMDVQFFGVTAGAHHVTNVVWHIANTLLLFGVLRQMTGAVERSAWVAALFAVHPLHVESVAWIAERKDVLSTCFWLLTIGTYVAYVRRPQWPRYLGVVGLFALALMSKPMVVTLPIVLLLLDQWPLQRASESALSRVYEKLPLFGLAAATGVATVVIQARVGAVASLGVLPWRVRAAHAIVGYVAYLGQTIWPTHLAAFYPLRVSSPGIVLAAALALGAITATAIRSRHRCPYLLVGWLWYLVTLAPVIGLVQAGEQAMADRFTYVPLIGLLLIVAWGVPDLASRWPFGRALVRPAAFLTVVLCAVIARAQVGYWSDSVTLWQHAANVTEANYIAHEKLGEAFRDRGDLPAAEAEYTLALAVAPANSPLYDAAIHNDLGFVLTREGKTREAAAQFALAVSLRPTFAEAQNNFGNALAAAGRLPEALDHYREALRLKPDFADALVGEGGVLLRQGHAAEAASAYREALRLQPDLAEAHNGLGAALALAGDEDQAVAQYQEALRLKPALATAHVNLAMVRAHQGQTGDAVDEFLRALDLEPTQPTWHFNVAVLLAQQGKIADARRHLETALSIDPGFQAARQLLQDLGRRLPDPPTRARVP